MSPGMAIQCAKRRVGLHMVGRPLIPLGTHGNVFYREPFESHYKAIREPSEGHQKALARREALERHQRAIREPWESHET